MILEIKRQDEVQIIKSILKDGFEKTYEALKKAEKENNITAYLISQNSNYKVFENLDDFLKHLLRIYGIKIVDKPNFLKLFPKPFSLYFLAQKTDIEYTILSRFFLLRQGITLKNFLKILKVLGINYLDFFKNPNSSYVFYRNRGRKGKLIIEKL